MSTLKGTGENDFFEILVDNEHNYVIRGRAGNDTIRGGVGDDSFFGEEGNDLIHGGLGADQIFGGMGKDFLTGGKQDDSLSGGNGNDSLYGYEGNDVLNGGKGRDRLYGFEGNDVLNSGQGDDLLYAFKGNDQLYGKKGNDRLYGYAGDDILDGGGGNDWLDSGAGCDKIVFLRGPKRSGVDSIYKFKQGQDRVVLSQSGFNLKNRKNLGNSGEFSVSDSPQESSAHIVYQPSTAKLFYNANGIQTGFGRDGGLFAVLLDETKSLSTNDFSIIK